MSRIIAYCLLAFVAGVFAGAYFAPEPPRPTIETAAYDSFVIYDATANRSYSVSVNGARWSSEVYEGEAREWTCRPSFEGSPLDSIEQLR